MDALVARGSVLVRLTRRPPLLFMGSDGDGSGGGGDFRRLQCRLRKRGTHRGTYRGTYRRGWRRCLLQCRLPILDPLC